MAANAALYTITRRSDAPGCSIAQPDFATQLANNNVIFRIPTPVFGLGLVEDTPDDVLIANAEPGAHFNHSANGAFGNFKGLPASTQQDILNFLRAL